MEEENHLLQALRSSTGIAVGAWQMLPGFNVSRVLASQGFPWILIDCEHGNIGDDAMHEAVHGVPSQHSSPIVRTPGSDPWMIKRALDSGAHGIMVPLIKTVAEAQAVVKAAKFPPLGQRGWGSPFPVYGFPRFIRPLVYPSSADYMQSANSSLITAIQIETKEALDVVDELALISGVDVLFVGPFDLGNNLGIPTVSGEQHPELRAALEKVVEAARSAGKVAGVFAVSGDEERGYIEMGFRMVSVYSTLGVQLESVRRYLLMVMAEKVSVATDVSCLGSGLAGAFDKAAGTVGQLSSRGAGASY